MGFWLTRIIHRFALKHNRYFHPGGKEPARARTGEAPPLCLDFSMDSSRTNPDECVHGPALSSSRVEKRWSRSPSS